MTNLSGMPSAALAADPASILAPELHPPGNSPHDPAKGATDGNQALLTLDTIDGRFEQFAGQQRDPSGLVATDGGFAGSMIARQLVSHIWRRETEPKTQDFRRAYPSEGEFYVNVRNDDHTAVPAEGLNGCPLSVVGAAKTDANHHNANLYEQSYEPVSAALMRRPECATQGGHFRREIDDIYGNNLLKSDGANFLWPADFNGSRLTPPPSNRIFSDVIQDQSQGAQYHHRLGDELTGPMASLALDSFGSSYIADQSRFADQQDTTPVYFEAVQRPATSEQNHHALPPKYRSGQTCMAPFQSKPPATMPGAQPLADAVSLRTACTVKTPPSRTIRPGPATIRLQPRSLFGAVTAPAATYLRYSPSLPPRAPVLHHASKPQPETASLLVSHQQPLNPALPLPPPPPPPPPPQQEHHHAAPQALPQLIPGLGRLLQFWSVLPEDLDALVFGDVAGAGGAVVLGGGGGGGGGLLDGSAVAVAADGGVGAVVAGQNVRGRRGRRCECYWRRLGGFVSGWARADRRAATASVVRFVSALSFRLTFHPTTMFARFAA
ncbi:hypothetical protein DFJ73DRAFT_959412 [Zopfochytrium polystomum]|nr:hypothetical protein DFJ73DRAFT_959412 [Zopfochytrium polystomum]